MTEPTDSKAARRIRSNIRTRATSKTSDPSVPASTKRPKTGGRRRLSIEEELARARIGSELAGLHDDTTLPARLAAIYLCISEKQLGELRGLPKADAAGRGFEGPPMIKIYERGAVGQNQAVHYKLGDLRAYQAKHKATTSFGSALNAGLLGWMTMSQPFFSRRQNFRSTILGNAWDLADPRREQFFAQLVREEIQLEWVPPRDAIYRPWLDAHSHKSFADAGAALLRQEIKSLKAEVQATVDAATSTSVLDVPADGP